MAIIEVKWLQTDNNYDLLTDKEKEQLTKLGVKAWMDDPDGKVDAPLHEFLKGMRYISRLHKKYTKEAKA